MNESRDRDDAIDLGRVIERVQVIHEGQKEQERKMQKISDEIVELKNNDKEHKIYQTQIFDKLNKIEQLSEHKSKSKKEIIYLVIGSIFTVTGGAISAYYATLAALHH